MIDTFDVRAALERRDLLRDMGRNAPDQDEAKAREFARDLRIGGGERIEAHRLGVDRPHAEDRQARAFGVRRRHHVVEPDRVFAPEHPILRNAKGSELELRQDRYDEQVGGTIDSPQQPARRRAPEPVEPVRAFRIASGNVPHVHDPAPGARALEHPADEAQQRRVRQDDVVFPRPSREREAEPFQENAELSRKPGAKHRRSGTRRRKGSARRSQDGEVGRPAEMVHVLEMVEIPVARGLRHGCDEQHLHDPAPLWPAARAPRRRRGSYSCSRARIYSGRNRRAMAAGNPGGRRSVAAGS